MASWDRSINSLDTIRESSETPGNDGMAAADHLDEPLTHGGLMTKIEPVKIKKLASMIKMGNHFKHTHKTHLGVTLGSVHCSTLTVRQGVKLTNSMWPQ